MNENSFSNIEKQHPDNKVVSLIAGMSWAVMNFDKRFPGDKMGNSLIVSPAFSPMMGFEIIDDEFCVGVSGKMYQDMWRIPWKLAIALKNTPGIHFCFATGAKPPNHYGIIRFYLRPAMAKMLFHFDEVKICHMSGEGDDLSWQKGSHFYLPLKKIHQADWA